MENRVREGILKSDRKKYEKMMPKVSPDGPRWSSKSSQNPPQSAPRIHLDAKVGAKGAQGPQNAQNWWSQGLQNAEKSIPNQ